MSTQHSRECPAVYENTLAHFLCDPSGVFGLASRHAEIFLLISHILEKGIAFNLVKPLRELMALVVKCQHRTVVWGNESLGSLGHGT